MDGRNPPTDNAVVAMKNDIMPSFAKLRLNESRLFQFMLAHYDSRKGENLTHTATVNDLREYFSLNAKSAYAVVEQAMLKLAGKPLRVRTENKRLIAHWFTDVTYHCGKGTFEFRLNDKAAPYFLMLQEFFTMYRLGNTKKFKRAASFKLYVNLKQRGNIGHWEVELEEIRFVLGATGKYPAWANFKRYILVPSVDEINEHSDISVNWKPTKTGRRVTGVAFKIREKSTIAAQNAREVHEANQRLEAAEEEEKRLGTTMGSTGIGVGSKKKTGAEPMYGKQLKSGEIRCGVLF